MTDENNQKDKGDKTSEEEIKDESIEDSKLETKETKTEKEPTDEHPEEPIPKEEPGNLPKKPEETTSTENHTTKEDVTIKEPEIPTPSEKPVEKESKKEAPMKDDFKYIVRIANTDIDGEKKVTFGLTQIKGIGRRLAIVIADAAGIDREIKIGDLTDEQIDKIKELLENLDKHTPAWMTNHRKDYDTGRDIHLISSNVDMRLRDDINFLKMIRSYKGIRHESGLTVRGQRTRSNGRRGLAMGVSKKSARQK